MQVVTVTENAIKELNHIIENQELDKEKVCLRVRICGGGCSGFSAKLDLDEVYDEEKDIIFMVDDIRVAVDKRSALYLEDTKVDFIESLDKRGFFVDIPAAKSRCGCGSSFSF
jgi:iron-sulfur cluster assembly protein